jgi:hypothetical protein
MAKLTLISGDKKYDVESTMLKFSVKSILSLQYSIEIILTTDDRFILNNLSIDKLVKIYVSDVGRNNFIGQGKLIDASVKMVDSDQKIRMIYEDEVFNILNTNTYSGEMSGELTSQLSIILSDYGIGVEKRYNGQYFFSRGINGQLYDIIRILTKESGIIWNIEKGKVILGDGDSKVIDISEFESKGSASHFQSVDGRVISKMDLSMSFSTEYRVGQRVRYGSKIYYIGEVSHNYVKSTYKTTLDSFVVLFQTIDDVFDYVRIKDEKNDVDDVIEASLPRIRYDSDSNSLIYYNEEFNIWLGNIESINGQSSSLSNVTTTILNLGNGFYIPYDIFIESISFNSQSIDVANIEITRNGNRIFGTSMDRTTKKIEVFQEASSGNFNIQHVPLTGSTPTGYVLCEMRYRRIIQNE